MIQSFPYSADAHSEVLVLGSMPGVESLRQRQYYAHPRNLFWDFMGELFEAGRDLPYDRRLARLRQRHVALWDVAHTCRRKGSLDADISDVTANDFTGLFRRAPRIRSVFFNGQKAAALFRKLVASGIERDIETVVLPSTSPANASIPLATKRRAWRQILTTLNET